MKPNTSWTFLALFACALAALFAAPSAMPKEKVATVVAEPLACDDQEGVLVCFDGNPSDALSCERLDDSSLFCTGQYDNMQQVAAVAQKARAQLKAKTAVALR